MASVDNDAVDRATLDYVSSARVAQDLLRQVLTQVAGYALMLMLGNKPAAQPDAAVRMARNAADRADEDVRALRVPETAAHHHHHLSQAVEATRHAFAAAEACASPDATDGERDALSHALRSASEHLRATSKLLPGFEMVDFGQACCAAHARAAFAARTGLST